MEKEITTEFGAVPLDRKHTLRVAGEKIRIYPITRSGRPSWTLVWGRGPGRKRREFSNPSELARKTSSVARALNHGNTLAANVSPAEITRLALLEQEMPGVSVADLIACYKRENPSVNSATARAPSVAEAADGMIKAAEENGRSKRHVATLRNHLTPFGRCFRKSVADVSTKEIDAYLARIGNKKTRLNHRGSIVALFAAARRKGWLPFNAPTAATATERPSVRAAEPDILTPEDMEAMLRNATHPKLGLFLAIGGFAGCRSAEIQRLRWRHVRPDGIRLGTDITKTGRRRIAEASENLLLWLEYFAPEDRGDDDFVSFRSQNALYKHLALTREAAETGWGNNLLRHSFVSCHLELYCDPPRTSKTSGHGLAELEHSYLKLVSKEDAARWFNIKP